MKPAIILPATALLLSVSSVSLADSTVNAIPAAEAPVLVAQANDTGDSLLDALKRAAGKLKDKTSEAWETGKDSAGDAVDKTKAVVGDASESVVEGAKSMGSTVAEKSESVVDGAKELGSAALEKGKSASETVVEKTKTLGAAASEKAGDLVDSAKEMGGNAAEKTSGWVDGAKSKGADAIDKAKEAVMPDAAQPQSGTVPPVDSPQANVSQAQSSPMLASVNTSTSTDSVALDASVATSTASVQPAADSGQALGAVMEVLLKDDVVTEANSNSKQSVANVAAIILDEQSQAVATEQPASGEQLADPRLSKVALSELVGQLEDALAAMEVAARQAKQAAKALNEQLWQAQ